MRRRPASRVVGTAVRVLILSIGAFITIAPAVYMLLISFKPQIYVLSMPPDLRLTNLTFANYEQAWTSANFSRYFLNSVIVAVITTFVAVWLSSMMAYGFARFSFRGKSVIYGVLLLGVMIPGMMLIIPQFVLAKDLGLIDSLAGLIVFYVASMISFNTFLLRGFFQDIPKSLEEAMIVDGAGAWRRYTRLVLPVSRPALATVSIFSFLASWDEFVWALTIINDPELRTLPIGVALFQGQNSTLWGVVFAASSLIVVPVIVLFIAFQRQFVSGLTAGAIKG